MANPNQQSTQSGEQNQSSQNQQPIQSKGAPEDPPPVSPEDAMVLRYDEGDKEDTVTFERESDD